VDVVHGVVERAYEPGTDARLPSLDRLPGVVDVEPAAEQELEAVYFDTIDTVLADAGITLCRCTGGIDDGWQLQAPTVNGARAGLWVTLGEENEEIPPTLRSAVWVHTRSRATEPVATLRTRRSVSRLIDSEGRVLVEVCDVYVTAHSPEPADTGSIIAWREWGVRLVDGETSLLSAVDELLQRAGGKPAAARSSLARVLGDRVSQPRSSSQETLGRGDPASAVVHARLRDQVAELKLRDPEVRRNVPDAVHKMRVAMRRLRSALATFRPLLDRQVTDPLRVELKWVAGVLGEARDAEVLHERLGEAIAEEPAELTLDPVAERIDQELGSTSQDALARSVEAMESDRYARLLDGLDRLVAEPPWTPLAGQPAQDVLPGRTRHEWRRLSRVVAASASEQSDEERDEQLHEVRKAAKRVRYAAETLVPVYGSDAEHVSPVRVE